MRLSASLLIVLCMMPAPSVSAAQATQTPQIVQATQAAQTDSSSAHANSVVEPEALAQEPTTIPLSPALEKRARAMNEQLRCPVCQSSSIEESPAREASEMKAVVRQKLAEGKTDREIKDYFLSKYGDWVMLAPPRHGFNLMVYLLPVLLVLGGAVFVYLTARRWVTNNQAPQ